MKSPIQENVKTPESLWNFKKHAGALTTVEMKYQIILWSTKGKDPRMLEDLRRFSSYKILNNFNIKIRKYYIKFNFL